MAQVGKAVFSSFSTTCLREALEEGKDEGEAMEELMEALDRLLK